ncbi:DUF2487 family protein [Oceanobacillus sp. Castelsardo]|uniref:DUF2487 family protein n=1 Tax=Oceanobacillus sp. Castelsardo TaxID=1851204 RepID=UPI0008382264|nr:DUF2487 family protein [Oceanobacillus sp. Castelsardo]
MKWRKNDMEQYVKAKEYIDTVIIPLIPFQMAKDQELSKDSFQNEALALFLTEMEKELSGRLLLTPNYHYIKSTNLEQEKGRLNLWIANIQEQPFNHIFFITFDPKWKKVERELDGSLIWLPGFPTKDLLSNDVLQMVRGQVTEISELIRSYW